MQKSPSLREVERAPTEYSYMAIPEQAHMSQSSAARHSSPASTAWAPSGAFLTSLASSTSEPQLVPRPAYMPRGAPRSLTPRKPTNMTGRSAPAGVDVRAACAWPTSNPVASKRGPKHIAALDTALLGAKRAREASESALKVTERSFRVFYNAGLDGHNPLHDEAINARALVLGATNALAKLAGSSKEVEHVAKAERERADAALSELFQSGCAAIAQAAAERAMLLAELKTVEDDADVLMGTCIRQEAELQRCQADVKVARLELREERGRNARELYALEAKQSGELQRLRRAHECAMEEMRCALGRELAASAQQRDYARAELQEVRGSLGGELLELRGEKAALAHEHADLMRQRNREAAVAADTVAELQAERELQRHDMELRLEASRETMAREVEGRQRKIDRLQQLQESALGVRHKPTREEPTSTRETSTPAASPQEARGGKKQQPGRTNTATSRGQHQPSRAGQAKGSPPPRTQNRGCGDRSIGDRSSDRSMGRSMDRSIGDRSTARRSLYWEVLRGRMQVADANASSTQAGVDVTETSVHLSDLKAQPEASSEASPHRQLVPAVAVPAALRPSPARSAVVAKPTAAIRPAAIRPAPRMARASPQQHDEPHGHGFSTSEAAPVSLMTTQSPCPWPPGEMEAYVASTLARWAIQYPGCT